MKYENIVFAQGDDADEPLEILDSEGPWAAVDYLQEWHYPGEHEINDELQAGGSDEVYRTAEGYVLTWNTGLGYIGLEYEIDE